MIIKAELQPAHHPPRVYGIAEVGDTVYRIHTDVDGVEVAEQVRGTPTTSPLYVDRYDWYDYEAPQGVSLRYTTAPDAAGGVPAGVMPDVGTWIVNPDDPESTSAQVTLRTKSFTELTSPSASEFTIVPGRGRVGADYGRIDDAASLVVKTVGRDAYRDLRAALRVSGAKFVSIPARIWQADGLSRWHLFGDVTTVTSPSPVPRWETTIELIPVERPDVEASDTGRVWAELDQPWAAYDQPWATL